jgi:hypothetical protein
VCCNTAFFMLVNYLIFCDYSHCAGSGYDPV